jgi:DNA-binding NtrC family response regulator
VESSPSAEPLLLGLSPAMTVLRWEIAAAARTAAPVLILGETGVGKEVVARCIHRQSERANRVFVAVNCGGIPETLLESELFGHKRGSFTGAYRDRVGLARQAARGTLFLDELAEMSVRMQAVLLRFAETGEIQPIGAVGPLSRTDVRLIAASHADLRARIADGSFREDLYYRLSVIELRIPPLRERREDIPLLVDHYLQRAADLYLRRCPTLTDDAATVLLGYGWPGNIRELRNITEYLVVRYDSRDPLRPEDVPLQIRN